MKGYVSAPAEVEVNLRPFCRASRSGLESTSPA